MKLRRIPQQVIDELLFKSKRRCAMCFVAGDSKPQTGQVAHLLPISAGGTNTSDNLVFLCLHHHSALDKRDISEDGVRSARTALYQAIANEALPPTTKRQKVFLIHNNNEVVKEQVLRFLAELNLEAIILSQEPSFGMTILEKIEHNADASYAIAILTRARANCAVQQNIIFEFGFFIGRLGRHRVCALIETGVDIPSDVHGALYIEMDKRGMWQDVLRRELLEAGVHLPLSESDTETSSTNTANPRKGR